MQTTERPPQGGQKKEGTPKSAQSSGKNLVNGSVRPQRSHGISEAINGLDATLERVLKLAGVKSLEEFNRLPKDEKKAFQAQVIGEKSVVGKPQSTGDTIRELPLRLVDRSPFNREHFNPEKSKELIESVRMHGVLQPGIARPHPTKEGRYEIVAGERRCNASRVAGRETMRFDVRDLTDEQAIELQAIENLQREDLNPIDEALKYQQLVECYERDGLKPTEAIEKVQQKLKVSRSIIYQRMRLLKLPDAAKKAMWDGRLPASHAELIAKLESSREAQDQLTQRILHPKQHEKSDGEEAGVPEGIMGFREAKHLCGIFEDKITAATEYNRKRDEFMKSRDLILSDADNQKIFQANWDSLLHQAIYAELDDNPSELGYKTWKQAVGRHAKTLSRVLGRYPFSGKPVIIYPLNELREAAKRNGFKVSRRSDGGGASESAQAKKLKERQKRRSATFERVIAQILKIGMTTGFESTEFWRFIIPELIKHSWNDVVKKTASRRGLPKGDYQLALTKHCETLNMQELRGLMLELVLGRSAPSHYDSGWSEGLKKACKLWKIELTEESDGQK